jgi:hypothetical protein
MGSFRILSSVGGGDMAVSARRIWDAARWRFRARHLVASFGTKHPVCFVEIGEEQWVRFAFSLFGASNDLRAACSGSASPGELQI